MARAARDRRRKEAADRPPAKLSAVGVSDDGSEILLARRADAKTAAFRLPIDDALLGRLEQAQERIVASSPGASRPRREAGEPVGPLEPTEAESADGKATEPKGTEPSGTEPKGTEPKGTEPKGTEPKGTEPKGTEPKGTEPKARGDSREAERRSSQGRAAAAILEPKEPGRDRRERERRSARASAAVAAAEPPPTSPTPPRTRPVSKLSPKEIQTLLRQGRSVASIAKRAGVDPQWVERFESPILWERSGMAARAQRSTLSRPRMGPSSVAMGEAVRANLARKGVALDDRAMQEAWDAIRRPKGTSWVVSFSYFYRGRDRKATWEYDPSSDELRALDKTAADLGWLPKRRRRAH